MGVALPGAPARPALVEFRPRCARTSSGTPCDHSARCSRNASSASSAQCRSSNTSTLARAAARPSRKRRQAVKSSCRSAGEAASTPTSGASRCSSHCRSGSSGRRPPRASQRRLLPSRTRGSALRLDDLAERPEGDPLAVGQAAALPPAAELRLRLDVGEQLGDEPALAHARLADDRDQLHRTLLRSPLESPDQKRLLELPADERRLVGRDVGAEAGAGAFARQSASGSAFPSPRPAPAARTRTRGSSPGRSAPRPRPRSPARALRCERPC